MFEIFELVIEFCYCDVVEGEVCYVVGDENVFIGMGGLFDDQFVVDFEDQVVIFVY